MNEEICALVIIPAKTDSKRVKLKNLRLIQGKTFHVGGMTWEGQTKAYTWAVNKFKEEV